MKEAEGGKMFAKRLFDAMRRYWQRMVKWSTEVVFGR
ncbi:MAG: hypothetical protein HW374_995 [Bacteroidetes bacterium]|nr:hypothetical protein [Bacteroidota bacterium]